MTRGKCWHAGSATCGIVEQERGAPAKARPRDSHQKRTRTAPPLKDGAALPTAQDSEVMSVYSEGEGAPTPSKNVLLSSKAAAAMLGLTPNTLNSYRSKRIASPPFSKVGRAVLYRISDIEAFLAKREG